MKKIIILSISLVVFAAGSVLGQPKKDSLKTNYLDSTFNSKTMDSLMKSYLKQMDDYNKQNKKRGSGNSFLG